MSTQKEDDELLEYLIGTGAINVNNKELLDDRMQSHPAAAAAAGPSSASDPLEFSLDELAQRANEEAMKAERAAKRARTKAAKAAEAADAAAEAAAEAAERDKVRTSQTSQRVRAAAEAARGQEVPRAVRNYLSSGREEKKGFKKGGGNLYKTMNRRTRRTRRTRRARRARRARRTRK